MIGITRFPPPLRFAELAGKDSHIIGVDVVNRQREKVGKVEDVAIHNRIAYLVLSFEAAEMNGKRYALPWNALHFESSLQVFVLDLPQDEIERLPAFENGTWPELTDSRANHDIADIADIGEIPPF